MIENYLSNIINMENFVDGMLVVDENSVVVHVKYYREFMPFTEEEAVGKKLKELYPSVTLENSPILRALKYGERTSNLEGVMYTASGKAVNMRTSTFPIKENGRIIGAVNVANYLDWTKDEINVTPIGGQTYKKLYRTEDIIGRSPSIIELRRRIQRMAKTNSTVLIFGETGTGKELVAQSLHAESTRREKLFISQNCAAIPENLLESIFFGTTKGSYTGAENRPGIFEAADGGTIFLDEINSMSIPMQAKLLRVLEEKKVRRIGSVEEIRVNVRVIAAVNEPPLLCLKEKKLRADLFYRLAAVTLEIPTLRERMEDFDLLLSYFISQYNQEMGHHLKGVNRDADGILRRYEWPGNVREFRNVLESAYNFCDGDEIRREDLPKYIIQAVEEGEMERISEQKTLKEAMDEYEQRLIRRKIEQSRNFSDAAKQLGITRQTLYQKLLKYGITAEKNE